MEGVGPFNGFVVCPVCGKPHAYTTIAGMKVIGCPAWLYVTPLLWDSKQWEFTKEPPQ